MGTTKKLGVHYINIILPILLFIGIKDYELSRGHLSVAISLEGLAKFI